MISNQHSNGTGRSGRGRPRLHPTRGSSLLLLAFDLIALCVVFVLFDWALVRGAAYSGVVMLVLMFRGHYRSRLDRDVGDDVSMMVGAISVAAVWAAVGVTVFDIVEPAIETFATASIGLAVLFMSSRTVAFRLLRRLRRRGHLRSTALVIGTGPIAQEISVEVAHRADFGLDVIGFVSEMGVATHAKLPGPIVGGLDDLAELARITGVDRVIVTLSGADGDGVIDALRTLPVPGVSVFVIPQLTELGMGSDAMTREHSRGFTLVRLGRSAHPVIGVRCKRLFDLIVSGLALVVLAPLLACVAAAVKLTSRGPVLFRQVRVGQAGELFELLKFRSMRVNGDSDTAWTPEASTGCLTPIGSFLRWTSLDELPQLFNIFLGDMSFVGPRPERPVFVEEFSRTVPGYRHRHRMPVGLTGLAQIRGLRGDTPIEERARFDNMYIDQWSFFGDVRILMQTVGAVIHQRAYAEAEIDLSRSMSELLTSDQVVIDLVGESRMGEGTGQVADGAASQTA